jgi:hypothetical protein
MMTPPEEFAECYAHYVQQPSVLEDASEEKYDFMRIEEFAECYAHYLQQPSVLEDASEEKYDFMRIEVFEGREYYDYTVREGG